jgi:hypothetical protein
MIAQVIAIAFTMICGAAVVRALGSRHWFGLWYIYGSGVVGLIFLFLPWSRGAVSAVGVVAVLAIILIRPKADSSPRLRFSPIDVATIVVLASFASFATITALWEWDAWTIWALKGRVFFEHGGIDWRFLHVPENDFAHPDYPLSVSINLALPAIIGGTWNDRWLGVVTVAMLVSGAATIRENTAREFSPNVSASIALAVAALGGSPYVDTAETPFLVCSVCALAFLRAGIWPHSAILLGLAALTKNEGVALIAAVVAGLLITRRAREILRLWPAIAIASPWLILRAVHRFPTDVLSGSILDRAWKHVAEAPQILRLLAQHTDRPWLWIAIIAALPFALRRERLLFTILAAQLVLYAAAFFLTPYDVRWHIANSWDRLSVQLSVVAVFATLVALARRIAVTSATQTITHVEHPASAAM